MTKTNCITNVAHGGHFSDQETNHENDARKVIRMFPYAAFKFAIMFRCVYNQMNTNFQSQGCQMNNMYNIFGDWTAVVLVGFFLQFVSFGVLIVSFFVKEPVIGYIATGLSGWYLILVTMTKTNAANVAHMHGDKGLYSLMDKVGFPSTKQRRVEFGLFSVNLAVLVAGFLEIARKAAPRPSNGEVLNFICSFCEGARVDINMLMQVPPYMLVGVGEIFAAITYSYYDLYSI
eukprot:Awhi_evm1s7058